jgi:hypothetical protein
MKLHIVTFNVPYPANYGGVIDVFYRIKALHRLGVQIHLHNFNYGRTEETILEDYCEKVYYYERETGILPQLSLKPYITNSRSSKILLKRLVELNAPIIFEGLHCCYYLSHPKLADRQKIVRMHNIEFEYYQHLAHLEPNWIKKSFFRLESFRLKRYQRILRYADQILAISPQDEAKLFLFKNKTHYIPAFHPNEQIVSQVGQGSYILFHADLSVKDNEEGAVFLIEKVFKDKKIKMPFIIAVLNPTNRLLNLAEKYDNISVRANLPHEDLQRLIHNAHVNILISFQSAGMKLKLLNAIFTGRFCLVNTPMVEDTGLEKLCIVEDDDRNIRQKLSRLTLTPFQLNHLKTRKESIGKEFYNDYNAQKVIRLIDAQK